MIELRPYQRASYHRLRCRLKEGKRRLLLVAPTGSGKTIVAAYIINSAISRGTPVLFFAHRRELIHQTYNKLVEIGIDEPSIGIMMAKHPLTRPEARIQVASIDTYRRRNPPEARLVIIDEAHRSLAATYKNAINHYLELGAVILGLTATPFGPNGKGLGEIYETIDVVSTPLELIKEGFLVEPRVLTVPKSMLPNLKGLHIVGGDYNERELEIAVDQSPLVGNIVEHWKQHAEGRRTVCFAASVAHSQHITARFVQAGVVAEHLDGETPMGVRDAILARLASGETRVVSNCGVLCEGWDMPSVKVAILARPTKSTCLFLQQAGRILRPYNDEKALILDHAGNVSLHGLPHSERGFSLDPNERLANNAPPTKVCPECHAVILLSEQVCPECGHEFQAKEKLSGNGKEATGSLVEVKLPSLEQQKRVWAALIEEWKRRNKFRAAKGLPAMKTGWIWYRFRDETGLPPPDSFKMPFEEATSHQKSAAYAELLEEGKIKGYKAGWASHRFLERFGHWPDQQYY